jgi:hypothetical protein
LTVAGPGSIKGRREVRFDIRSSDGTAHETVDSSFFGPM